MAVRQKALIIKGKYSFSKTKLIDSITSRVGAICWNAEDFKAMDRSGLEVFIKNASVKIGFRNEKIGAIVIENCTGQFPFAEFFNLISGTTHYIFVGDENLILPKGATSKERFEVVNSDTLSVETYREITDSYYDLPF